jgi:DUF1680 family protein
MALAKLYKVTKNENYLKLAKYFVEETGRGPTGTNSIIQPRPHAHSSTKRDCGACRACRISLLGRSRCGIAKHDTAYFHALKNIWENMAGKKLYITGGIGSRAQGEGFGPNYELHNHQASVKLVLPLQMCTGTNACFWLPVMPNTLIL